ncbi:MAG: alkaline phosphatase family protein [Fibrobacterales bacterium]
MMGINKAQGAVKLVWVGASIIVVSLLGACNETGIGKEITQVSSSEVERYSAEETYESVSSQVVLSSEALMGESSSEVAIESSMWLLSSEETVMSSSHISSESISSAISGSHISSESNSSAISSSEDGKESSSSSVVRSSSSKDYIGTYNTDYVFIVVIDGVRWSEGWGHPQKKFMPRMRDSMADEGVVFTNFRNGGPTYTVPSHSTMLTGVYEGMNNFGKATPSHSSIMNHYRITFDKEKEKTMIFSGKGKLQMIGRTTEVSEAASHEPFTYCGEEGGGINPSSSSTTDYWDDKDVAARSLEIIDKHHPEITLVNFYKADSRGHDGIYGSEWHFNEYTEAIEEDDAYVYALWQYIQSDSVYQGKTSMFVTHDHGRHLDDVGDKWPQHGHTNTCEEKKLCDYSNNCDGCDHIFLYAYGPDFPKGTVVENRYALENLAPTIEKLLDFDSPHSQAGVIEELFE